MTTSKYAKFIEHACKKGFVKSLPDCKVGCSDSGSRNSAVTALIRAIPSISTSGKFHDEMASRFMVNNAYRCPNEETPSSQFFKRTSGVQPGDKTLAGDRFLFHRYKDNEFEVGFGDEEDPTEPLFRF